MKEKIYEYSKNFAVNLKAERLAKHFTQKQMAEKMNIKTQSYQAYECNISMPTAENLLKIVEILNISLDELFEIKK